MAVSTDSKFNFYYLHRGKHNEKIIKIVNSINCMFLYFSNSCLGGKNTDILITGYTSDGVYYEVYGNGEVPNSNIRGTISVTRKIIYEGRVTPPSTIDWTEMINGTKYIGTIELDYYMYTVATNRTTAYYDGLLTNE